MSQHPQNSVPGQRRLAAVILCALCACAWSADLAPAAVPGPAVATAVSPAPAGPNAVTLAASPVLAGWLDPVSSLIDGMTGNRARVIQFATVIMILALWVIWWRK